MKFSNFSRLFTAGIFVWLFTISAAAQDTGVEFGSYTSINYDEDTNIVTAYSQTDSDYNLTSDYEPRVLLTVTNDYGVIVASGNGYDDGYGYATVELSFAGEPDRTYTAVGSHRALAYLWDYDYDFNSYSQVLYYYDNWYFTSFESGSIYQPWYYSFYRPSYNYFRRRTQTISLGRTYDSVSTTASTCLVTYNKYFAQAKDYGGNHGKVNEITRISTAWNTLKRASDATVVIPDSQVKDGKGNVYQKYNQTSTIGNLTLVGTISISSGPDSEKKLRFTKP